MATSTGRRDRWLAVADDAARILVCSWRGHTPMLRGVRDPIWMRRRCREFITDGHGVILRGN